MSASTPSKEKLGRTLFHLAWPLTLTGQLDTLNDTITTFWVGRLGGTIGLAVLGIMRPIVLTMGWLLEVVPAGARSEVARHVGARSGRAGPIMKRAMLAQLMVSAPLAVLGVILAAPVAAIMAGDLAEQEHILRWYLVPWSINLTIYALVRVCVAAIIATGWTRVGLFRVIVSLGLEAVTIPLFMWSFDLGMVGVPIAELLTDMVFLALILLLLRRTAETLGLAGWRGSAPPLERGQTRRLFAIGGPGQLARAASFIVIIVLTRRLISGGGASLAALALSLQLLFFIAGITLSIAGAASILVGQSVGAKRPERALAAIKLSAAACIGIGATVWLLMPFVEPVLALFTSDAAVLARATDILVLARWGFLVTGLWQLLAASYTALGRSGWAGLVMAIADCAGLGVALLVTDPIDGVAWWFITSNVLKAALLGCLVRPILLAQLR